MTMAIIKKTKSFICNPYHSLSVWKTFIFPIVASMSMYKKPTPKINALMTDMRFNKNIFSFL